MIKVLKIDTDGFFIEDVIIQDGDIMPDDCLDTQCPDGFCRPKWDGEKWIEGGTAPVETAEQETARLKAELKQNDYKIIKCYEYQLAGLDMPYDITELHTSRQAIRDKINELESTEVQNG